MISTGLPIDYWDRLMAEDPRSIDTALEILRQMNKGAKGKARGAGNTPGRGARAPQMSG